jgi:hypothetical protein
MSQETTIRRLLLLAEEQGWRITRGATGHLIFWPPDTSVSPVSTLGLHKQSSRSVIRNVEARLARAGLKEHR